MVPMSHPFIERLIGTVRRERLDHVPVWHAADLERKLRQFNLASAPLTADKRLNFALPL